MNPDRAIEALRHAVQDHGDEASVIRPGVDLDKARWIGRLLGVTWPNSYLEVLARHDGALLHEQVFGLMESFDCFAIHRDAWGVPRGYWPIGGDGCGNYYVLATQGEQGSEERPIGFIDSADNPAAPAYWVASTYPHFIVFLTARHCARHGCSALLEGRGKDWPFDADFVLQIDPGLTRVQSKVEWPK